MSVASTTDRARILVVDDAPDQLLMARRALRRAGHEVITASTAADAEARWTEGAPDLVLLDVNLPDANGVELSNRWKQSIDRMAVPIILWSSVSVSAAEQALGLESGADGYLIDPVEPEVLAATVAAHLRIVELIDDLDRASTEATELVRYSLALGQAETPEQVLEVLDIAAQRALRADSIRLEWRHVHSGVRRSHGLGDEQDRLNDLIAEARATTPFEARFHEHGQWAVVPFHVVGADGHLALSCPGGDLFDVRRRQFFIAFTNVTSLSLARAETLHLHRSIANTLQEALLPKVSTLPGIETDRALLTSEETTIAGGDWLDGYPIETPNGPRQVLAIGDVVGHGAPAAGESAVFRHSLRALLLAGTPVDLALSTLEAVLEDHPAEPKGTLALVELDPATGKGRVFSAGHLPPVVLRSDGSARRLDLHPCPPLGFGLPQHCTPTEFTLGRDDHLILFTDGVVERRGDLVDDGYDQLEERLREAHATAGFTSVADLIATVREMILSVSRDDDALVVALRCHGDVEGGRTES